MPPPHTLEWRDPLEYAAAALAEPGSVILLHSAAPPGGRSLLGWQPEREVVAEDFSALAPHLSTDQSMYDNAWLGYFGYALRHGLEQLPHDPPAPLPLPALWMVKFAHLLVCDHRVKTAALYGGGTPPAPRPQVGDYAPPPVAHLRSTMDKAAYLAKVEAVLEAIRRGDLYQANLTRKFMGEFAGDVEPFRLFRRLCAISPSPYSAYMRLGDTHILSSSPECFLTLDAAGNACARPIKGTAPRHPNVAEDARLRGQLAASAKDRAENLMIVDLMRNDFARGSTPGSVEVQALYEVTTHPTIHHMSSTITGKRHPGTPPLDFVRYCFPPGSMTGAPKIHAMRLCSALEQAERGVYSGALGWLGGDGSLDLSVVIRTLVIRGRSFEFQVGGAIVADSQPLLEWQETLAKARALAACLGLSPDALEAL